MSIDEILTVIKDLHDSKSRTVLIKGPDGDVVTVLLPEGFCRVAIEEQGVMSTGHNPPFKQLLVNVKGQTKPMPDSVKAILQPEKGKHFEVFSWQTITGIGITIYTLYQVSSCISAVLID